MKVRMACFVGWSDTGKTGFIIDCIEQLTSLGKVVGAVKCVHHEGSFNVPGKDTTRFFEAGARAAIVSDREAHLIEPAPSSWNRQYLESLFPKAGVLLVEGRLLDDAVHVLVGGAAMEQSSLKFPLDDFDVVISNDQGLSSTARGKGCQTFRTDQAAYFVSKCLL
jgi:molybdopterin-guanine dinucleotide biosynthesis protein MobB